MSPSGKPLFSCTADDLVGAADLVWDACRDRDKESESMCDSVAFPCRYVSFDACLVAVSIIQLYAAFGAVSSPPVGDPSDV